MAELGERVARMEGELDSLSETVLSIKGYLERSATERTTQHTLVITQLTKNESKLDSISTNMEKYQTACDTDREAIAERVDKVEKKQSWQSGIAAGIAAIISAIAWGFEYLRRG